MNRDHLVFPIHTIYIKGASAVGKTTMAHLYAKEYPNTMIIDNWNYPPTQMLIDTFVAEHPDGRIVVIEEK